MGLANSPSVGLGPDTANRCDDQPQFGQIESPIFCRQVVAVTCGHGPTGR